MNITITAPETLDAATSAAIQSLVARCNAAEGLDLPIAAEVGPSSALLLAHLDGQLAGTALISYSGDAEICVCVAPARRRRGVGRALALAARAAVAARGQGGAIFVVDTAAESGRGFAAALGARLDYAEHRLDLDMAAVPPDPPALPGLSLRAAEVADAPAIVDVLVAAFGDPHAMVERFVGERIADPDQRFLLADLDGRTVGTLRLVGDGGWIYVTTFGVRPELHGRGIGRRLLLHAIGQLRDAGDTMIRIEVDVSNAPALGLYEACGFRRMQTFAYMLLPDAQ